MSEPEDTAPYQLDTMEDSLLQGDRPTLTIPEHPIEGVAPELQESGIHQTRRSPSHSLQSPSRRISSPTEETAPAPPSLYIQSTPPAAPDPFATLKESTISSPTIEETGPVSVSTLFPVPYWERYEAIAPIGEGGMGTVYKARDPRLNRFVALKFIRGNDPRLVDRFFREARAQARIDHPNVCKVFDVGEVQGHPYIAMEFVDGKPLDLMARKLGLEQKVRLIRDVAQGLHAAHRIGLIHRDIKPANILVGHTQEGDLHPSVVDFGLARETSEQEGQTIFGIQGTPAYMSPEQAAGDMRALDRRTDVYSLGATLYELLCGRPPFTGKNLYDLIGRLSNDPPKPLRELDQSIPADVETIVLRCLEKEPSHRYDSAKAFADDLTRWLEGEPIHAKPLTILQQIRVKAKKNKAVTVLIALSSLAFVALIGVSIRARVLANEQAELTREVGMIAQEFGQDVKEMELFMRYAYALPLHDTTREKDVVRARMRKIEEKMAEAGARLGALIGGPGHFALGKGYMALQEPEAALPHILKAEQHGNHSGDLYKELGSIHGFLYQRGMDRIRGIEEPDMRKLYQQELERQHLEPARRYLGIAASKQASIDEFTEAKIAFYEQDYETALKRAGIAAGRSPWIYEVIKLEGDIFYSRATALLQAGQTDDALEQYRLAIAKYEQAAEMGTSDPLLLEALTNTWLQRMQVEEPRGIDVAPYLGETIFRCEQAIAASPGNGRAFALKAMAFTYYGERIQANGNDPRSLFQTAIDAGKQAIHRGEANGSAYRAIGISYWLIADYEMANSIDASPSLEEAIHHLEEAVAADPLSSWTWNDLGISYGFRGQNSSIAGSDPRSDFQAAITALNQSIDRNPFNSSPKGNIGWFQAQTALYGLDYGESVADHLVDAFSSLDLVLSADPNYFQAWNNLGLAHTLMARYEFSIGEDPSSSLERAMSSFSMALQISPDDAEAEQGIANVLLAQGKYALHRKQSPMPYLNRASQLLQALLKAQSGDMNNVLASAEHQKLLGEYAVYQPQGRESPDTAFERSRRILQHSIAQGTANLHLLRALAGLYETWAQAKIQQKKSPSQEVKAGLSIIAQARNKNPKLPALDAMEGAFYLAQAQAEKDKAKQKTSAELAYKAMRKAVLGNSYLRRAYEPLLMQASMLKQP